MKVTFFKVIGVLAIVLLVTGQLSAAVTGKIVGRIVNAQTGEPLIGANILLEGTEMGAASDADGYYLILNVRPGMYTARVSMMGYQGQRKIDIEVNVDRTSTVDFRLTETAIQGQEVVITAGRTVVPMDVSSTEVVVTPDKISQSMFHDVKSVVGAQMGIQAFAANADKPQIRGSDMSESAMMMDGMLVVDNMLNRPLFKVNLNAVQEIKVMTGGFNAEYGNVRSGVINVVTKEGGSRYSGTFDFNYSPPALKHFGPNLYGKDSPIVIPFTQYMGFPGDPPNPFTAYGWKGWYDYAYNTVKPGKFGYQKPYDLLAKWLWQHRSLDNLNMLRQLANDGKIQADLSRISDDDAFFDILIKEWKQPEEHPPSKRKKALSSEGTV